MIRHEIDVLTCPRCGEELVRRTLQTDESFKFDIMCKRCKLRAEGTLEFSAGEREDDDGGKC